MRMSCVQIACDRGHTDIARRLLASAGIDVWYFNLYILHTTHYTRHPTPCTL